MGARTLFLSRGLKAPGWYRCALPALALGCDWVAYGGEPPDLEVGYGRSQRELSVADLAAYDVIVVQQPAGTGWLGLIREWQRKGIVVLADIDDYLRGVSKRTDHDFAGKYTKSRLEEYELCLRAVDGVICSTPWLAQRYRSLNPATYVCQNGLDLKRYALTRPERSHVGVGWSGATGHTKAIVPWLRELQALMREREDVHFISVGQGFATMFEAEFGRRALTVPFAALEVYPSAMTLFDVALAPAGANNFFRGKSDLRWLEASALGIPTIADPVVYPEIEHGVTGFHASRPAEMREILAELVADEDLRRRVGAAAKADVSERRSFQVTSRQWVDVLQAVGAAAAAA
ncbi:glycosyltransferase family protein [Candidatus Solirubrobacter pratensis]|uniref:glycosyltransferase family protein n=1 Tax=Candidatus Solirubrobacter pratensis TaxID=1298857 RepID=UPI0004206D2B|nr:glycosyltransferase [Candidatus Solirubrobacter pratensis]